MKCSLLLAVLAFSVSCSSDIGIGERSVWIPAIPEAWRDVLGEPAWLVQWYGPDGIERQTVACSGGVRLELPEAVSSPILAYPYWPRLGIGAGIARPAGAVYPFAARDHTVELSWKGGVAAFFYRELQHAGGSAERFPERFDWPRFLDLLDSDSISPEARSDPWTVDWRTVAIRTRVSGFDRRRIKPRDVVPVRLSAPAPGKWIRTSPFLAFPVDSADGFLCVDASEEPDSLLSPKGTLVFGQDVSAWFPSRPLE
jgi:hypothetical protein